MTAPLQQREQWSSFSGFILASIGAAVGLGNIWRFSYIAGENGGGAFLVPYLVVAGSFGLIFMMLEFGVGRRFQKSIIPSMGDIRKRFKFIGVVTTFVTFSILSYYLVIVGWVISYVYLALINNFMGFEEFSGTPLQLVAFLLILAINYLVIRKGVSKGIEKLNKIGVVLLIAVLVPMTIWATQLDGAEKAFEFYLTPDISGISDSSIWLAALGQIFFSLGAGQGILLAYGSYLDRKTSIVKSSAIITAFNCGFSIVAGLLVFSLVFAFGIDPEGGITLIFQTMPTVFDSVEYGQMIGIVFFSLLLMAGITSSVSLFQVPVASLEDELQLSKKLSTAIVTGLAGVLGFFALLSYTPAKLAIFGMPVLDFMDLVMGTYGLEISATLFVVAVTWFMHKQDLLGQINQNSRIRLPLWSINVIRFVLPVLVILVMISNIIGI